MKKLLLFILMLVCTHSSLAQKIRFADSTNVWEIVWSGSDYLSYETYHYIGDTLLNGYKYLLLAQYNGTYLVRQDSNDKVYVLGDSTEVLLYDFSRQLGDTFTTVGTSDTFVHHVAAIDTIIIRNEPHKVYTMKCISGSGALFRSSYIVVEGIGTIDNELTFPLNPTTNDLYSIRMKCFSSNGQSPRFSDSLLGYFDNTTSCYLSAHSINTTSKQLTVSPHPANSTSIITLPNEIRSGTITLANTLGQTVTQQSIYRQRQIPVNKLTNIPGIYYYTITDNTTNKIYNGKMLYQ